MSTTTDIYFFLVLESAAPEAGILLRGTSVLTDGLLKQILGALDLGGRAGDGDDPLVGPGVCLRYGDAAS